MAAWLTLSQEGTLHSITLLLAGPAVLALAAGLALARPEGIPIAIFTLGIAYGLRLAAGENTLDRRAPLVAAALYAVAELSYWSLELRLAVGEEAGAHLRRVGLLAATTVAALVFGVVLLTLVDLVEVAGVAVEAVGAAAAVAVLALLALASRRAES